MASKAAKKLDKSIKGDSSQQRLTMEYWTLDRLLPYDNNPRKFKHAVKPLANSVQEFGFLVPILAKSDGLVVDGHLRLESAASAGLSEVPVITVDHLSDAQIKALRLSINKMAELAEWDFDLLRTELFELRDLGFDLDLTGFSRVELDLFTKDEDAIERAERTPALPKAAVSRSGDVWLLDKHRLVVGDCTNPDDVAKALNGARPHLCCTDQPYGIAYDANWRTTAKNADGKLLSTGTGRATGEVQNDDKADWREAWALFPGDVIYVWHADTRARETIEGLEACGFEVRAQIIWAKNNFAVGRGDYHHGHEPCQPAGTLVSKVIKEGRWKEHSIIEQVPIESLKVGDKVVSYSISKIFRRGREITSIGSRRYTGNMHRVGVGSLSTRTTAEHRFTIRFDPEKPKAHLHYLMRKGDRWRVGICKIFNSRGFGLAVRLDMEQAEAAWIISAHPDVRSARIAEQVTTCLYGIPTTCWEMDRNLARGFLDRTKDDVDQIYQQIGVHRIADGVSRLMADRGLNLEYPLISAGEAGVFSRKQVRLVQACNLVPGIMQIPVPTHGEDFEWVCVSKAEFEPANDVEVWSMDVDRDHHYVADGIVTHNCIYAVRKGKKGHWNGSRKESTVWQIDKPQKSETGHSTQKPIECMRRPIVNNSKPGDLVYEPFAGSGTTIMGCELTERICLALEIDPKYTDVCVKRWQSFTGQQATLESTGQTFEEVSEARYDAVVDSKGSYDAAIEAKRKEVESKPVKKVGKPKKAA